MVISEEHKFIFISVPKTGSSSAEKFFREKYKSIGYNRILAGGKEIKVPPHITALQLRRLMGDDYGHYHKIAFIRHPYSKLVSGYFFYKNGTPITPGNTDPWPARIRIFIARLLPFTLWALVYPFKSNRNHLCDEQGRLIVEHVGKFENLEGDLRDIFRRIGIDLSKDTFPHTNKSSHDSHEKYFKNRLFKYLIDLKLKKDIDFYNGLVNKGV
jgi:hypothetical protein